MGHFPNLCSYSQLATFVLLLCVVILTCYAMYGVRVLYTLAEEEYHEFQLQIKHIHRGEYVPDRPGPNSAAFCVH